MKSDAMVPSEKQPSCTPFAFPQPSLPESETFEEFGPKETVDFELQDQLAEGYRQGFQQGVEEGRLQGEEEGYQQGFEQGLMMGKQNLDNLVAVAGQLQSQLRSQLLSQHQSNQLLVCDLVENIVRQVLLKELNQQPEQILYVVEQATTHLPDSIEEVHIYLNPQDIELLKREYPDQIENWQMHNDPNLAVGGCIVKTEHAEADARIERRTEECLQTFREAMLEQGNA